LASKDGSLRPVSRSEQGRVLQGQELGLQGLREHPEASEFPWTLLALDVFILEL